MDCTLCKGTNCPLRLRCNSLAGVGSYRCLACNPLSIGYSYVQSSIHILCTKALVCQRYNWLNSYVVFIVTYRCAVY